MKRNSALQKGIELLEKGEKLKDILHKFPFLQRYEREFKNIVQENIKVRNFETNLYILIGDKQDAHTMIFNFEDHRINVLKYNVFYLKYGNKQFDNYLGEEIVILDDFNGEIEVKFLLELVEKHNLRVITSWGKCIHWSPTRIYIVTNEKYYEKNKDILEKFVTFWV